MHENVPILTNKASKYRQTINIYWIVYIIHGGNGCYIYCVSDGGSDDDSKV